MGKYVSWLRKFDIAWVSDAFRSFFRKQSPNDGLIILVSYLVYFITSETGKELKRPN